jgi:hypothetical protein
MMFAVMLLLESYCNTHIYLYMSTKDMWLICITSFNIITEYYQKIPNLNYFAMYPGLPYIT